MIEHEPRRRPQIGEIVAEKTGVVFNRGFKARLQTVEGKDRRQSQRNKPRRQIE
jgi:hypothetical protein